MASYTEEDIMHEGSRFWVLRDRTRNAFTVCEYAGTHSVTVVSFALNPDGLSLALAYARYKDQTRPGGADPMQHNEPHPYQNPPLGGGACALCRRPPEHSVHTYTLPGFEQLVQERENKKGDIIAQQTLF
jgi:hypothetical protein